MKPIEHFVLLKTIHFDVEQTTSIALNMSLINAIADKYDDPADDWDPKDERDIETCRSIIGRQLIEAIQNSQFEEQ